MANFLFHSPIIVQFQKIYIVDPPPPPHTHRRNWNFQRGGGPLEKIPINCFWSVWLFSGTSHCNFNFPNLVYVRFNLSFSSCKRNIIVSSNYMYIVDNKSTSGHSVQSARGAPSQQGGSEEVLCNACGWTLA